MSFPGNTPFTSLSSYGQQVELHSKISEVDRAFFGVLNMDFSMYNEPAETGYYYDCECEDTFNFERFRIAAQHFTYYRCNKALKGGDRVRAKYIDLTELVASKVLTEQQAKNIISCVQQEFEFLSRVSAHKSAQAGSGLVNVFLIAARSPLIYYTLLEKPDETLAEYLRRTSSTSIHPFAGSDTTTVSVKSRHWKINEEHIPLKEAKIILRTVASTVLKLHRCGIIHGSLAPCSIFIFRRKSGNQTTAKKSDNPIEAVKLANFTFVTRTEQSQTMAAESLRVMEINAMYEIAVRIAENTAYASSAERNAFADAVRLLCVPIDEAEIGQLNQEIPDKTTDELLELFTGFMRDDKQ